MMSFFSRLLARFVAPRRIYADYAAATPLSPEAAEEMSRAFRELRGNPSSIHAEGRAARALLEEARTRVARALSVQSDEIVFTSGGTESNNLAVIGTVRAAGFTRPHLVSSRIEHGSVLEPLRRLEEEGAELTLLHVDNRGRVSLENLTAALRPETVLVSVAYANGEIGSVERIRDISRALKAYRESIGRGKHEAPYLHTDASQAPLFRAVHPGDLGVDLLTLDASKVRGPQGAGLLYVRRGLALEPLFYGGGQERGIRSGTENVPAALGFAVALERAALSRKDESARLRALSLRFMKRVAELLPQAIFNSAPEDALPHIVNLSLPGLDAEFAAVKLDTLGVSASSASACRSIASDGASYVIEALPGRSGLGSASLRFSFGRTTTLAEVERIAEVLRGVVG
ncbi:MAG TPA: cysteine desulfurase family protein [Candidatus Paceibacterota bacterium]|nr:cysteine desulfurase family protein [Candidatus Paceibacterota bacterium]